ncbi:MAG: DUF5686 and carboxypeptidase regulatory-like domain-containing protein [Bacteroidetes bacterium]|nr:DUF5686 and carboxypeptidase regulatory-like domain-containing protein [Bacteroidota bacterium]
MYGQSVVVEGIIRDKNSREPLAFVHIIAENTKTGATSDIDGKFSIKVNQNECCLNLTYVGYESHQHKIDFTTKSQRIFLNPKLYQLDEVEVFPGINPAHRIIKNVVENRNENNPEKLDAFTYTSYDKMVVTVDADSLMLKDTALLDTNQREIRKFLDQRDIFLMETVTERKYMSPGLNQENVLATRVSGFKDPLIAFMISQIQSTSFYDELIQIAGNKYINPISKGSTNKYFFLIEDTTYNERGDSIFTISFRPMKNTNFEGLRGFLYINSYKWAVQNVKAQPPDDSTGIVIKIQQAYDLIDEQWFPTQLNTDIIFTNFSASAGQGDSYALVGKGRSYIRDINLNPDLKKKDFGYHEVEIESDAAKKKGEFWQEYRIDSLTQRELETYRFIDSIGNEANFDRMATIAQTLLSGRIPIGFIDIDLDKLIRYNSYEGFYLGLGLHTNDRVSKKFKVGGFWGYGFGDKRAKYGLDASINVHKRSESVIRLDAYNKVIASGGVEFFDEKYKVWDPGDFYKFFTKRMNVTRGVELAYSFRLKPMRDFKWSTGLRLQEKKANGQYYFTNQNMDAGSPQTTYNFTDLQIGFRFAFREKVVETTKGQISFGSKYPVVWLNYTKGIAGFMGGMYNYDKIDLKIEGSKHFKYLGDFHFRLMSGIVLGEIPVSNLYIENGSFRTFTIYAPNSFGTMRTGEFLSDRYASLYLTHNFGNLLLDFKRFHPEFMIVTNITFGTLSNEENHHNIEYNTLEKGYYESGLVIRKLLDLQILDLGVGVLYRYGPYGFDQVSKNFAYKFSIFYGF